ncbi:MAG: PQQ-binding-like beta-propeller repeat protein [Alphaproteobacteria bacterium]|nr:PQQ-binding-like beta-propeller repeat protein [Alphaproteobacteria bacterium]
MIAGTVGVLVAATSVLRADDAMFRGNLAHTGVYAGPAPQSALLTKWMFHTKGQVIASPTVANGLVYIGSTDGRFHALDLATGAERWDFKTGARITSTAAVANGTAYFESFDGNFYALDAATGALRWKFAVLGERRFTAKHLHGVRPAAESMPDPFDFYLSSPAVWNGAVYFGSGDGNVYALDAKTGAVKWKVQTGDVVHASPAIADGMLFIGSWDSWFYALDAVTGALKWRFKTGEDAVIHNQQGIQSSAAVADGMVYFGCRDSNLYALDEKTGTKRWNYNNKGSWVIASPAVRDGVVYAATSDTGQFYALDGKTGAQLFVLDFRHWPMFSSPALAGGFAYVGSHQGKLFAIDLKGRKVAWEFQTDASKALLPKLTDAKGAPDYATVEPGNFYDEMVVAVAKFGELGQVLSSPVIADGLILFGATDGNVYALSATG